MRKARALVFETVGLTGLLLLLPIPLGMASNPCGPDDLDRVNRSVKAAKWPQGYLEFLSQKDARCQTLSGGGLLRLIKNNHPSKKIKYRLVRYFADVKQPGLVQGIIEPSSAPLQLGCTLVDGREQRWEVQTANFAN